MSDGDFRESALAYHRLPVPGKIAIVPTKTLANQRDLALAYSPGVAHACWAIMEDSAAAAEVTSRANMVAVVTNGTAVLGLGDIGPLAAKPVMEGKAVLFKEFAGIDAIDLEVRARDPDQFVATVAALEDSFGAINLEDIKAPECFEIEEKLDRATEIPVFHDDQHGTAIIVAAAVTNWLRLTGRRLADVRLVTAGAGAAAMACVKMLAEMGLPAENIWLTDIHGLVYEGRPEEMDARKAAYAKGEAPAGLADVITGAEIFLGLSAPEVLAPEALATMADKPLVMALANPVPEIMPDLARRVRPDATVATGRSDFPNQVNNVLCFPFIFRAALDVGATHINAEMKRAAVTALADLALAEGSEVVENAYGEEQTGFGPDYLIPRPFDPRLIGRIGPAVAKAAMDSGVATRPVADLDAYRRRLERFVFRSGLVMRDVVAAACREPRRVVFCEGEERRVLRAVQMAADDGICRPVVIGRRAVVQARIRKLGLRLVEERDFELVDPQDDPRYNAYWTEYHRMMARHGVSPDLARTVLRTDTTVIGALMVHMGDGDGVICGTVGRYGDHLDRIRAILGQAPGASGLAAMNVLVLPGRTLFIADTYVGLRPDAESIAGCTLMAADIIRRFGIEPRAALLSHSNFGTHDDDRARAMAEARARVRARRPDLEVEGEMHGDAALSEEIRARIFPEAELSGSANLLIMPSLDAANIAFNLLKVIGEGLSIGPILMGAARPAHILTPSVTARGIYNMTALVGSEAQAGRPLDPRQGNLFVDGG